MIAVHDLRKQYGEFTAVDGVSLDVQPGQIHGFLGPNGAGKTTTIRMIAGLLKPTPDASWWTATTWPLEPEAAKAALGFIPDRPFIYEKLTAGEFLRFHGGLYGMDDAAIDTRIGEMLELFELARWRNELVESFSHGMKQRLGDERGVPASAQGGAGRRADGRPRPARRAADQGRVPQDERARRGHPDEHAHLGGGRGDVRRRSASSSRARSSRAARWRNCGPWAMPAPTS